ncbi:MAG: type II toxin-antitoxin system RelE/ParE family toxin [Psychrosphaera sp.]|nr:type II toxin-antitoxin system RelE/ParE family toxin [Psychrosphaera sp.]
MLKIAKSPLALKDAQSIWVYSFKQWGESQANAYLQGLDSTIRELAVVPNKGIDISFLREGFRRYRYKSHVIVYRYTLEKLEILRILHVRMDIARHRLT